MKKIKILFILFFFVNQVIAKNITDLNEPDTLPKKNPKIPLNIGIQGGYHSSDFNKTNRAFDANVSLGLYLKFDFSNNIFASIGYSYWKSHISGSNLNIPPETINSNGAKFELDFSLIENNHISLLLGPSLLIEGVSTSHSTTFTYGAQLKLNYALLENRIFLVSTLAYQNGGGIFDLAGGGFNYSFFNFLTGIEVNLSK